MDIVDRYHAVLMIRQLKEEATYFLLEFQFSWKNSSLIPEEGIVHKQDIQNINQVLTGTKGITQEAQLYDIGGRIWGFIPANTVRDWLTLFDKEAKELLSHSNSRITLTIVTDTIDIPWELSLTPDRKSYWFKRYLVARQIWPYCHEGLQEPEKEKPKNILLITDTFNRQKIKNKIDKTTYFKWESRIEDLENLINKINNEQKEFVHVELRKYSNIIYGDLIAELQGAYDAIIYIGSYLKNKKEGMAIEDRFSGSIDPLHYDHIKPSKHPSPLIFFDACQTGISKLFTNHQEIKSPLPDIVHYFLPNNASAFVGTIQNVEVLPATAFGYYFLESLCQYGASLSQAILDARNRIEEEFKEGELSKYRRVQSSSYILIGDSHVNLHNSFLHKRKKIRLIWPATMDCYCEKFKTEIYPSGFDKVELYRCDDFNDLKKKFKQVQAEMTEDGNLIPIFDMPILYAVEIISNTEEKEEWVIINSIFKPTPGQEEAALYRIFDLEKIEKLLLEDYTSQVSAMCCAYLKTKSKQIFERCTNSVWKMEYENILDNMIKNMEDNTVCPVAFILVGECKLDFDNFLSQQPEKWRNQVVSISLHNEFKRTLECAEWKKYQVKGEFPTSVLVARKSHAIKYRTLIMEVLSRWYEWVCRRFPERHPRLSKRQTPLFTLNKDCKEAIIQFSKFVYEKEGLDRHVFRHRLNMNRPLQESDFFVISPRQLSSGKLPTINLEKLLKDVNHALSEIKEKITIYNTEAKELKGEIRNDKLSRAKRLQKQLRPLEEKYHSFKRELDNQTPINVNQFLKQCQECIRQAKILKKL